MGINKTFSVRITESKINKNYKLGDICRNFQMLDVSLIRLSFVFIMPL